MDHASAFEHNFLPHYPIMEVPSRKQESKAPHKKSQGFRWKEPKSKETPIPQQHKTKEDKKRKASPVPEATPTEEKKRKALPAPEAAPAKEKTRKPAVAAPQEPMIVVNINDRLGTKAAIPCLASDPIKLFKAQVAARIGREPHEILLKRQGERPFKDQLTLADYGVSNGVQLDLEVDTGD